MDLSINRNQVSRKGFAVQQNNPLFFKGSKSCLGCPDMRTLLATAPTGKNYTHPEHTPTSKPLLDRPEYDLARAILTHARHDLHSPLSRVRHEAEHFWGNPHTL